MNERVCVCVCVCELEGRVIQMHMSEYDMSNSSTIRTCHTSERFRSIVCFVMNQTYIYRRVRDALRCYSDVTNDSDVSCVFLFRCLILFRLVEWLNDSDMSQ